MDIVAAVRSFLRVAETGSFSTAAIDLGLTQSSVSRQVAALEEHFAVRLFHRTTSGQSLTVEGERTLPLARQIIEAVETLSDSVGGDSPAVRGRVRLSVPTPLGFHLADHVGELLAQHPDLDLELMLRDQPSDIIEDGIDLEVRLGAASDSSLISRRIGSTTAHLVASPDYLRHKAPPSHPSELNHHDCICYDRGGRGDRWVFSDGSRDHGVQVRPRLASNSATAVHRAALAGAGLAILSHLLARLDIERGRLIPVMTDYPPVRIPMFVVYPSRRHMPTRARAVLEFLIDAIGMDEEMKSGDAS